jgi:enterochelin esterase-like enzyme
MKTFLILFFATMMASDMLAQEGKIFDDLSMKSTILKMERKYAIYLPPDYETSQRSYPVLYLLHGGGGDQAEWIQRGEVKSITDRAINEGSTKPLIIVMPDASGPNRGYGNDATGKWLYEDFFFQEFIPYIEKTYRIRPGKMYRSVAGLSMGGKGTFTYALHHPEMFKAACPLSAATAPLTIEQAKAMLARMQQQELTDDQIEKYYDRYGIIEMINNIPEDRKAAVRWYIDCGDDDPQPTVWEGNCLIHIAMRKKGIPHEFRIRDGAHTWAYWRSALPEVLKFVSLP